MALSVPKFIEKMPPGGLAIHGTPYCNAKKIAEIGPKGQFFYLAVPTQNILMPDQKNFDSISDSIQPAFRYMREFSFKSHCPKEPSAIILASWDPKDNFEYKGRILIENIGPDKISVHCGIGSRYDLTKSHIAGIARVNKAEIRDIRRGIMSEEGLWKGLKNIVYYHNIILHDKTWELAWAMLREKTVKLIEQIVERGSNGPLIEL